jgi:hypothetical protein
LFIKRLCIVRVLVRVLVTIPYPCSKQLKCVHTRTLQMSDGVLCVKVGPDQKLLAVSVLDSSVKVG